VAGVAGTGNLRRRLVDWLGATAGALRDAVPAGEALWDNVQVCALGQCARARVCLDVRVGVCLLMFSEVWERAYCIAHHRGT
jgi:hypothetical protein